MTEQEWLECTDPFRIIKYMGRSKRHGTTFRKLRLFACACCRQIWDLISDHRSQGAVELAERYAEGEVSVEEMRAAVTLAGEAEREASLQWGEPTVQAVAGRAAERAARVHIPLARREKTRIEVATHVALHTSNAMKWAKIWGSWERPEEPIREQIQRVWISQCQLIRDIVANPFHPVLIVHAWLTPTVLALAQAAYDNRRLPAGTLDNDRLAVLADALEDASCTDQAILGHLRSLGPHVRGCYFLDLLLGK